MKNNKKDLSSIYFNRLLRSLGFSLAGIFIPIYFLTLGFSFVEVLKYFLVLHIITFAFVPIALILSKKIGYKPLMILSVLLVVVFLSLLQAMEEYKIPIYLIAALVAINDAFYFIPLHAFFTRLSDKKIRGAQFSYYESLGMFSGLIGPLIGAFIATFFGFSILFYSVIFFVLISSYPLLKLENVKPKTNINFSKMKRMAKRNKRFFLGTMADEIKSEVEGIIWPIFIFLTLGSLISVGFINFTVSIGSILLTLTIGKFYDLKDKYLLMKIGGALYALTWLARIYFTGEIELYSISLAAGFFMIMVNIPFYSIFYDKASEEKNSDEFIIFREIPVLIGKSFLWVLMILLVNKFIVGFILAGLASLVFVFFKFGLKNDEIKLSLKNP